MAWKLTVRAGPRVQRERHASLADALSAAERHVRELASHGPAAPVDARIRRFEPAEQVRARVELAGPERLLASVRAGYDVRGDGSVVAYLGRIRRDPVEPRRRETVYQALRRELDRPS
jgi:hypothetical protein